MTTEAMRRELKLLYTDSNKWADRVNKMKPNQVLAVFNRLRLMGLIKI